MAHEAEWLVAPKASLKEWACVVRGLHRESKEWETALLRLEKVINCRAHRGRRQAKRQPFQSHTIGGGRQGSKTLRREMRMTRT